MLAGFLSCLFASSIISESAWGAEKLNLVTTTGILADAVCSIGGSHVTVKALMGPGIDPHLYRQTSSDIAAAYQADAVFWQGLNLEAQLKSFLENMGKRKTVVALGDFLPKNILHSSTGDLDIPDPHIWFDPSIWKLIILSVRNELTRLKPEAKSDFHANTEVYLKKIDEVAEYAKTVLASVPEESRILVTAHDAFHYFGRAYKYEVRGIQGISTESEAGLKQIEDLVQLIVDKKLKAIFVESSVPDRNIKALIEGAAARGHIVLIGGELFSDAAGAAGTYEGTYIGMLDHNATTIARALGGQAPEKGFNGRLAQ